MAVEIKKIRTAPGHPGRKSLTKEVKGDATRLIRDIRFDQLRQTPGTIRSRETCRLDRQSPPRGGGVNLQVQLNGVFGQSSISTLIIHGSVFDTMASSPIGLQKSQEGWLMRLVKNHLNKSLANYQLYELAGSFDDDDMPAFLTPSKRRQ